MYLYFSKFVSQKNSVPEFYLHRRKYKTRSFESWDSPGLEACFNGDYSTEACPHDPELVHQY